MPNHNTKKKTSESPYDTPLLEIVLGALEAKWRVPSEAPDTGLPPCLCRDALLAFEITKVENGYVANIAFDVAPGEPDTIGTPDAHPLPTYRDAFLAGTATICSIVSGSPDLPFLVLGDELMVVSVTKKGQPMMMRRPFPTQYR